MKCITIVRIILAILGLIFIGLGAGLGWGAFPNIVDDTVEKNIDLTDKDSEGYKNFEIPPVPVYMKFTIFNFLNPKEFINDKAKPKFEEKGPYVYREVREKKDIVYDNDASLNYSQYRHFEFEQSMSCAGCTADDPVTILNMPLIGGVAAAMKKGGFIATAVLNVLAGAIKDEGDIALTDTVDNILFNGVDNEVTRALMESSFLNTQLPPAIQDNGFAIFNTKNATTHNENYKVWTDVDRHTQIALWGPEPDELVQNLSTIRTCPSSINGKHPSCVGSDNPVWWPYPDGTGEVVNSNCNLIKGTNAEQFPPSLEDRKDEDLWIFTTDLCRSMFLRYLEEQDIDGIKVYRYSVPEDGGNVNKKDNICFCKDFAEKKNAGCLKNSTVEDEYDISDCEITNCHDGLQDVENCMKSPVMMSSPHFFMADAQLDHFDGSMKRPVAAEDRTYLDIEPVTGMVLRAHKKIQVNMPVVPTGKNNIAFLEDVTNVPAFPVLWLDEGADIDEENIDKIKGMVTIPLLALEIVKYGMLAVGGVMLLVAALMCC